MSSSVTRPVFVTRHEEFWLDVIRSATGYRDPVPTLSRTQRLRQLFQDQAHDDAGAR